MVRCLAIFLILLIALPAAAVELPRENLVLHSVISVDAEGHTVTLPLHRGRVGDRSVWYILMDSSDPVDAATRGVVFAPLLAHAGHVQAVKEQDGIWIFAAAPDFSAARQLQPGGQGFPPAIAIPGATAPSGYSPFIRLRPEGPILNAPIVAVGDGPQFDLVGHSDTGDRVMAIDSVKGTVTLLLSQGFAEGRRVVYISTEASDPAAAALERATLVPALGEGDADVGLLVFANAPQQGMAQALMKGGLGREATMTEARSLGAPLNILMAFPMGKTAAGYSPLWRVTLAQWAKGAVPEMVTGQAEFWRLLASKRVTGLDGNAPSPADFVVNCPVIAWIDGPVP